MKRYVFRTRDSKRAALAVLGCYAVGGCVFACVIADPQTDLPQLPAFRPTIVHASVVPPEGVILTTFPSELVVPVELVNPSATFEWRVFVDYDPVAGTVSVPVIPGSGGGSGGEGGIEIVEPTLTPPDDLTACHKIEFLVATSFPGNTLRDQHTPDSLGGDIATWFYAPSGNLNGCPVYDAGIVEGGIVDAGTDADGAGSGQQ